MTKVTKWKLTLTIDFLSNYNYGLPSQAIGVDLINNPKFISTNQVISFKIAIWLLMTPKGNKPSSHNVIIGKWRPSHADRAASKVLGYGVIVNIMCVWYCDSFL
jgi:chitinase